jgi:hypothetical protein
VHVVNLDPTAIEHLQKWAYMAHFCTVNRPCESRLTFFTPTEERGP